MQSVLTKSDGKIQSPSMKKRVKSRTWTKDMTSSTLPRFTRTCTRYEIYRRNARDMLRVETGVQNVVAKDTLSMMKLAVRLKSRPLQSSVTAWFPTP